MQTNPIEQNNSGSLNAILMNRKQNDFISRAIKKNTFSDDESDNQSIIEDDDDEENQLVVTTGKAIINEPVDVPKLTIAESDKESRRLPNDLLAAIVARSAFIITSNDNLASGDKHDAEQEQTDTLSTAPVIEPPVAGAPENPFAQSAAQFRALRDQLDALLIAEDFRSHAPQSAVHALNCLKADWTQQALQFERITQTRMIQEDVDLLKYDSLQSLMHVRRALAEQGNLWHRWVRPLLNALISWIAYVESCLGVPNRFQPRLFKATYAEEAFQTLQPDDNLREVHAAYARGMSAVAMAEV